ncbi:response regulator transcription factor [Kineosporia mesophila]|uniref:Response regulator transcription factor n=1 Tax=Kineosporia mesophila TaxID=566012 RepID=A0ABP6ZX41_9ACTN|nr:response regulator transcription factor [Kineosporia mesophila]MCD5355058.1 response regulator transcription factor [Kineosporia mesophila]
MTIGVLLVDDQPFLRLGLRMVLEPEEGIEILGEAEDGSSAVPMAAALKPDVVLMDIRMHTMDGITATEKILADRPQTKVLILTTFDLDEYVFAGLRAGASGFLLKDAPPDVLLTAIRTVATGDAVLAPSVTRRLLERFGSVMPSAQGTERREEVLRSLTEREQDVFLELAAGQSNQEIAAKLYLSEGTIKVHVGKILAKLGLRDRVQAVVLAYETGVVVPGSHELG